MHDDGFENVNQKHVHVFPIIAHVNLPGTFGSTPLAALFCNVKMIKLV